MANYGVEEIVSKNRGRTLRSWESGCIVTTSETTHDDKAL